MSQQAPQWRPRYHHVTQLRHNPNTGGTDGREDCFEAACARYLRETYGGTLPAADVDLIDEISLAARGLPDSPYNQATTVPECERAFIHFGTRHIWTQSYPAALASRYSICLVDGTALQPRRYPPSWFGDPGQPNHFVLWLPYWDGADNWFDDPLVQDADCRYSLESAAAAFAGAYLLPDQRGVIEPLQRVTQACSLKVNPNHTCAALARLAAGEQVLELGIAPNGWPRVSAGRYTGFVPPQMLAPAVAA